MLTDGIKAKLERDPDFQHLESHINEHIDALDSLEGIDFSDKEAAAIEGRARALAKEKLLAILDPFGGGPESTGDDKEHVGKKTGVL